MNRLCRAGLAVAAVINPPSLLAGWYGYVDIGPRYSDVLSADSDVFMDSRGAFLGFAVEQALTDQVELLVQAEYEIDADADSDKDFGQNDTFIGLSTPLGSLRAGNLETPLRHLADPVDRFPDTIADPSELWNGDVQATDSLYYQSPNWKGLRGEIAVIRHDADNSDNGISGALWFETDAGGMALASEEHVLGDDVRRHRVTLFRSLGAFDLGMTAERESQPDQPDTLARLFSLAHTGSERVLKLQYGKSDIEQYEEYLLSVGVDFLHSSVFSSYVYLHRHEQEEGGDARHAELGLRFSF